MQLGFSLGAQQVAIDTGAGAGPLPTLARTSPATIAGTPEAGATVTVDALSVWTVNGTETDADAREYRIVLGGVPGAGTTDPTLSFAAGSDGESYRIEERARFGPQWSDWLLVTEGTVAAAPTEALLAHGSATLSVTGAVAQGLHADGTPWVAVEPGAQIVATSPESAALPRAGNFPGAPLTAVSHGLEYAPGRATEQGTTSEMQATNDDGVGANQGFDALVGGSNLAYNGARNIDPALTGQPAPAAAGVYLKAISRLTNVPGDYRPTVESFGIFTVYSSGAEPGADRFRPGFASDGGALSFGPADLDLSVLANVDVAGYGGPLPSFVEAMDLLTGRISTEQRTYNAAMRNVVSQRSGVGVAGLTQDVYAGYWYEATATIALLCNTTHFTASEKRALLSLLVQEAIDITARAQQGGVWEENGGHCAGRKELVALAARLTGEAMFGQALALTTTRAVHGGGTASIWGTDRQIFAVTQADIDRPGKMAYPQSMLGYPEWSSDATRDNPDTSPDERHNSLGIDAAGVGGQTYRHIIAKGTVPAALALQAMGAKALFGNDLWFDYQDRHMAVRLAAGTTLPQGDGNDVNPLTRWLWETYRPSVGPVWEPAPGTPPSEGNAVISDGSFKLAASAGVGGNVGAMTLRVRLTPAETSSTTSIFSVGGRSSIRKSGENLSITLKDTSNTIAYGGEALGAFQTGQEITVYVAADFAGGTLTVEINGQPATLTTPVTAFAPNTSATDFDRPITLFNNWQGALAEIFLDDAIVSGAALAAGDLAALEPRVLFGPGQTSTGWNAGTNLGVAGDLTPTGTVTDVI